MHGSRRSNRGPWKPTPRDAIVVSAETIAFLGQVVLCEGKGNVTKFGDDYRRYMQRVPRVNFVTGLLRWARRKSASPL